MNTLFKTLAALVAAFTFSSSFAGTIVGCKMEGGQPMKIVSYTADEMSQAFLDHRGARTMVSGSFWDIPAARNAKTCDQALEAIGLKKPVAKKAEVKSLGGKPEIANPQKALVSTEYCNNGVVHYLSITFGNVRDAFIGGACQVDPKKTLVLAGL